MDQFENPIIEMIPDESVIPSREKKVRVPSFNVLLTCVNESEIKIVLESRLKWKETLVTRTFVVVSPMIASSIVGLDHLASALNVLSEVIKTLKDRLANACRLWLQVLYIKDITAEDGTIAMEYYHGTTQCTNHSYDTPYQEKPPPSVWTIWQEVLRKSCLARCQQTGDWFIDIPDMVERFPESVSTSSLPTNLDSSVSLETMAAALSAQYQQLLGGFQLPQDDGETLAKAVQDGSLAYYSDGSVREGCGLHAYTLRPQNDHETFAITGSGPMCGDPSTVSSLRPEHNGTLVGSIWLWLLEQKYNIQLGSARLGIDNMAVLTRLSSGTDTNGRHIHALATDYDLWYKHKHILKQMKTKITFFHVKGHQDDMDHCDGQQGPMTRDAYWNIQMDRLAESYRLKQPTPLTTVFSTTGAAFIYKNQVITTTVGQKIRDLLHSKPLWTYIQQKENWTDDVFDSVDWPAFEWCMNKLSVHKRINVTKYVFNWQNTGRQKQLFELGRAARKEREPQDVGQCPMGCSEHEDSQHYL